MTLGSEYDDDIIKLLALAPQTATRLAHQLNVDDGTLVLRLHNELFRNGVVKIVGADGSSPLWGLTDEGRERRERLRERWAGDK